MLNADVIAGFVGSILSSRFDGRSESAEFHKECWELCTSPSKFVAIAAPRGHAKSSAVTLGYGLATLLFRERKFMVLVSDTEGQAAGFLNLFKAELLENEDLITLFDLRKNDKGLVQFIKDTETDFICEMNDGHKFRVIAKGAEQKLRGLLWNGSRPDIIMCDDLENEELTMNKDRREKMKKWFNNALLPCRSDQGIVRVVGTVMHMDSLLEGLMPNPSDKQTVDEELKQWTTRKSMWKSVKYRAHNPDFTKLLWPEKKSEQEFRDLMEEARNKGNLDGYSQEYLNYPLDESVSFFRRQDFLAIRPEDEDFALNIYITADLAISEKERADFSVFIVGGVDEQRRIHIIDIIRARMDGREIVETILTLERTYKPEAIGIEKMQVSQAIGPFLREEMHRQNTYPSLIELSHGGKDKQTRGRSIQARMRAKAVKFDKEADWYPSFEDECLSFPRGKNDDQVDAFAYLGMMLDKMVEAPTRKEQEDLEYEEELAESQAGDTGRNSVTGY